MFKFIKLSVKQYMKQHRYSQSTKILPRSNTRISQTNTQQNKESSIKLPLVGKKKNSLQSLSNFSAITAMERKSKKKEKQVDATTLLMMTKIKEKCKLLGMLKQKILECNDNLFVKKVVNQIRYTSIGIIAIQMWTNVQLFQNCDIGLFQQIYAKYDFTFTQDSLKTMDFINNVCRFMLADYKKKRWLNKEKQVNKHISKIQDSMLEVGKRAAGIQIPDTKMQIISSLAGMRQQCYAKKPMYLDWKSRATQMLKSNQIKCDILRAEIFTQNFF